MKDSHNDSVQKLQAYLRGELDEDEIRKLRAEIAQDAMLEGKLEKLMFDELLAGDPDELPALSEQKQRQILRKSKWRSRFSHIFFTTGGITAIIVTLLILSQVFNYLWFWPASKDFQRVMEDVVTFTNPGMSVGGGGTNGGLFFSMEMKYDLEEKVGRERKSVGKAENDVFLFKPQFKYAWNQGFHQNRLFFHFPPAVQQSKADTPGVTSAGWRTLEKLPEGTVAQLAVSFDRLMTHDEYFAIIRKYDLDTTWLAIDTGQEGQEKGTLGKGEVWGYDTEAHFLFADGSLEVNGQGERRSQLLIRELEYLDSQKALATSMLEDARFRPAPKLGERIDYLKQHGVKLYGAVITGPTKELLKLKQETRFSHPYVGQVEWWNWDQAGTYGIEYSY
ncbi:anti sigma factor C-terminal domain-containing protein [Brevibacillus fluminis]|uniref:anti sigma factor C-terminal domain-containing protein n=1 Tax=Brevibacillus fluminis TaxID=511487 RepID=UPI003F892EAB